MKSTVVSALFFGLIFCSLCLSTLTAAATTYGDYQTCLRKKCDQLFCLASDRECQREITRSEECKKNNLNCQAYSEWVNAQSKNTINSASLPNSLQVCYQNCKADQLASETFRELEQCQYKCIFYIDAADL